MSISLYQGQTKRAGMMKAAMTARQSFMPLRDARLQRKCSCGGTPGPTGECEECRKKKLQRKTRNSELGIRNDSSVPPIVHEVLRAPGQPLDAATRAVMEPRFRHDFSQVRVHTDAQAAKSARAVNASAYTVKNDIVFAAGEYMPATEHGIDLLDHELTHVMQQAQHGNTIMRQQAQGGAQQAEERAWIYPHFPGCPPWARRRLDYQILRSRSMTRIVLGDLDSELNRPQGGAGIITITGSALQTQFHTQRPAHIRTLIRNYGRILNRLERGPNNFRCVVPQSACNAACGGEAYACAGPSDPVRVCPDHFRRSDTIGALTLIHEAAHQAGLMRNTVRWEPSYVNLTTAQALTNADSYGTFVRDDIYGGALVGPRPSGAQQAPEQPHERELREQSERRVWTPQDMSIDLMVEEPAIVAQVGFWVGRIHRVPATARRLSNRFRGQISFFPDSVGLERSRPYTPPLVSLHILLVRNTGRRSTLIDSTDSAARDIGGGSALRTNFRTSFDFHFGTADRGTLQIEARLRDFDTATTITYRDALNVNP